MLSPFYFTISQAKMLPATKYIIIAGKHLGPSIHFWMLSQLLGG